jgi:sortase A
LLITVLAGMTSWCLGQLLKETTARRVPEKLWKATPLVVNIPAPPVRVTSFSPGETIGRIAIPRMSLDSPLLEMANCDDQANLDRGPAHIGGTAVPGAGGNCAIAGHRSTYTQPFQQMGALQAGDEIILIDASGARHVYAVSQVWVVSPEEVSVLDPTPEPCVTLITCHPFGSDRTRLIVRAVLSG